MSRTRIKICGIRDRASALAAVGAGADALGFVFVRASPRWIDPADAYTVMAALPPFVATVGLFMDATVERFADIEQICPTHLSQLHGSEPVDVVRRCGPGVIKAVRFDPATIAADMARWSAVDEVDAVLVDGSAGGEGVALDWNALASYGAKLSKPLILAGGLSPANVGDAIRAVRPYAVDVSSGVERERGVKDAALITAFCRAVRRADVELTDNP